ncbi:MAG: VOC family protein [bacterium]|nr:VOC family protein [bacterium]
MSNTVTPFLMFEGRAEEAMNFYISLFADGRIDDVKRYGANGPAKAGAIMSARFTIGGQTFIVSDSTIKHEFTFTPSISIFVECADEAELADRAVTLADGGQIYMPMDNYGFSRKFAWVGDRFGVSWQLNLQ